MNPKLQIVLLNNLQFFIGNWWKDRLVSSDEMLSMVREII